VMFITLLLANFHCSNCEGMKTAVQSKEPMMSTQPNQENLSKEPNDRDEITFLQSKKSNKNTAETEWRKHPADEAIMANYSNIIRIKLGKIGNFLDLLLRLHTSSNGLQNSLDKKERPPKDTRHIQTLREELQAFSDNLAEKLSKNVPKTQDELNVLIRKVTSASEKLSKSNQHTLNSGLFSETPKNVEGSGFVPSYGIFHVLGRKKSKSLTASSTKNSKSDSKTGQSKKQKSDAKTGQSKKQKSSVHVAANVVSKKHDTAGSKKHDTAVSKKHDNASTKKHDTADSHKHHS